MNAELFEQYRQQFGCNFPKAQEVFPDIIPHVAKILSKQEMDDYLAGAKFLCNMGRGVEPVLIYLEEMPNLSLKLGGGVFKLIADYSYKLVRSPNNKAIVPFLTSLASIYGKLDTLTQLNEYLALIDDFIERTQIMVHGHNALYETKALIPLLNNMNRLSKKLSLDGIRHWIDYGIRHYNDFPDQQAEYFALTTEDSLNIMQRERHGTIFKEVERPLYLFQEALWETELELITFSTTTDQLKKPVPYLDATGIRLPDVYDELPSQTQTNEKVSGLSRYRATLAHMLAHHTWSGKTIGDNMAPQVQLFLEVLEDTRVEYLAIQKYPGLRALWNSLHPVPKKDDCNPQKESCLRYRMARLSKALLDPNFNPEEIAIKSIVEQFKTLMKEKGDLSTIEDMRPLATEFFLKTKDKSDSLPNLYFTNTEISYRDDNRNLWVFHEDEDEDDDEAPPRETADDNEPDFIDGLPPRHYDEWDYISESYRPDWTSVYERKHPSANPADIDKLLEKHAGLIKQLKKLIEALKPQNKRPVRFQEEGSELDLDVAIRSIIDYKSGSVPDPRINYSHETDSRSFSVMILVDMSHSLQEKVKHSNQTLLQLSQEALAITAWVLEQIDDNFAIAGFHSDTRHEVRYHHIKGFSENWDDTVKARIAAMDAAFSTRMGPAIRHASHYLKAQTSEKKLMLILTDGEPADIDVKDPQLLIEDTRKAVVEAQNDGIYPYCISLDKKADNYIQTIFGQQYTIIDQVQKLPEELPKVFMKLTN